MTRLVTRHCPAMSSNGLFAQVGRGHKPAFQTGLMRFRMAALENARLTACGLGPFIDAGRQQSANAGVRSVPHFVFGGSIAINGGRSEDEIAAAIQAASGVISL